MNERFAVVTLIMCLLAAGAWQKHVEPEPGAITTSPTAAVVEPDGEPPADSRSDDALDMPFCPGDGVPLVTGPCQWVDDGFVVITTIEDETVVDSYPDGSRVVTFTDGEVWFYGADGVSILVTGPEV